MMPRQGLFRCWSLALLGAVLLLTGLELTICPAVADSSSATDAITLPWGEFRNLLNLDENRISLSWEEFKQLAAQSSSDTKIAFSMDGGNVVLTRDQFRQLLEKMVPPAAAEAKPPQDFMFLSADYAGRLGATSTRFVVRLELEIFPVASGKSFRKIPLFKQEIAVEDIRLDGQPVAMMTENGWQTIVTDRSGRQVIEAVISMSSSQAAVTGLDISIPATPITHVSLRLPQPGMLVHVTGACSEVSQDQDSGTMASAWCVPGSRLQITWRRKAEEKYRGPAKVYAEVNNLLSVEADAIRLTAQIKLNIMQNPLSSLSLLVSPNYQVLEVVGQSKQTWQVDTVAGRQVLTIPFDFPLEGQHTLTIRAERLLPKETMMADFSGIQVMEAVRESGYIAGEVKSDAEATVREVTGSESVDFQKIPAELSGLSSRPLLFACRYVRHPYHVVVDITKHTREEALSAVIDLAQGSTLLQSEGKLTHRFVFTVRNLWKQFLKLKLPAGVRIWSVIVDGKREKASQDAEGRILIPLARSQRSGGDLQPFLVELIYTEPTRPLSLIGLQAQHFPSADLLINSLTWDFFMPVDYRYPLSQGDFKREPVGALQTAASYPEGSGATPEPSSAPVELAKEMQADDNMLGKDEERKQAAGPERERSTEEIDTPQKASISQPSSHAYAKMKNESAAQVQFSQQARRADRLMGSAGLMSVQVNVPFYGKRLRFTKTIVDQDEKLSMSIAYLDERVAYLIWALILAGLGAFGWRFRGPLAKTLVAGYRVAVVVAPAAGRVLSKLRFVISPIGLPITLFLVAGLLRWLDPDWHAPLLFVVIVLGFIVALIRLLWKQVKAVLRFLWRPYTLSVVFLLGLLLALYLRATQYDWKEYEGFWIWFIVTSGVWAGSMGWSAWWFLARRKVKRAGGAIVKKDLISNKTKIIIKPVQFISAKGIPRTRHR